MSMPEEPVGPPDETKECPFCAETIKARAIKCRFCGSDLATEQAPAERTVIGPVPRTLDEFKQQFACPKCGSRMIEFRAKRKAGWGAAMLASEVGKPNRGLLDGLAMIGSAQMINQQDVEWHCLKCGKHDLVQNALNKEGPRRIVRPDGMIEESTLRNGKAEGPYMFKTEDGRLVREGTFKASKPHGEIISYHKSGQVESRQMFQDGVRHGRAIGWYENGNQRYDEGYNYGNPSGVRRKWSEDGILLLEAHYQYGKAHGPAKTWYPDGKPKTDEVYSLGVLDGPKTAWQEDGTRVECVIKDGKAEGPYVSHHLSGQREEGVYEKGHVAGVVRRWDAQGTLVSEVTFKRGKKHGPFISYANGVKASEGSFKDGELHGPGRSWYPDGNLSGEYPYANGNVHGVVRLYHASGGLKAEGTKQHGKDHGDVRIWYPSGRLRASARYSSGTLLEQHYFDPSGAEVSADSISGTEFLADPEAEIPDEPVNGDGRGDSSADPSAPTQR
jgi:antitoxin component YwqK of YwqJK toxin-antitoxin module/predicted RNA-binding Zn-ribbon protein involved in translation (DUF1610 family)